MAKAPMAPANVADYGRLLAAVGVPSFLLDHQGTVLGANPDAERVTGVAKGLVGQPFGNLVAEGHRHRHPLLAATTSDPRERPANARLEVHILRKDGTDFPAEVILRGIEGTAPPLSLAVVLDIVDAGDSTPGEIRRLKEMAEFRAQFLNIAAHELKTPLTPIRLQVQILQNYLADAPEHVAGSLKILARSVERLHSLMDDVLDAARIQATRLRLRQDAISLTSVVTEAIQNYEAVAEHTEVQLVADVQPDVTVIGDRGRLLQVLNNLLSNSLKFTVAGGRIVVTLKRTEDWATLRVEDTGRGMTPDQLRRLFQPFTQVHADLEATQRGTGLGLYITKGIVDQHGGTIAITSRGENQGTEVLVRLPTTSKRPMPDEPYQSSRKQQLSGRLREMV